MKNQKNEIAPLAVGVDQLKAGIEVAAKQLHSNKKISSFTIPNGEGKVLFRNSIGVKKEVARYEGFIIGFGH